MTEKNEQIDGDRTAKTEYTYDKRGNLVMVKNCMEDEKAQYVQYVYDIMGNKVRQFTGMTEPLTLTVSEVVDAPDGADTFSYARTYDYQNHLTAMKNQTGSARVISEYSSEYLVNGQKSREPARHGQPL